MPRSLWPQGRGGSNPLFRTSHQFNNLGAVSLFDLAADHYLVVVTLACQSAGAATSCARPRNRDERKRMESLRHWH